MKNKNKIVCELNCYLDGDSLCIIKNNFINLQESEAVFIKPTKKQLREIIKLKRRKR